MFLCRHEYGFVVWRVSKRLDFFCSPVFIIVHARRMNIFQRRDTVCVEIDFHSKWSNRHYILRYCSSSDIWTFFLHLALDQLGTFQEFISPRNLPSLKHDQFQFLFRFPAECEHEWLQRFQNHRWLFNNTAFHLDEYVESYDNYDGSIDIQPVLLTYSQPFHLLKHMRTVQNYTLFVRCSSEVRKNSICQSIEWLCEWTSGKTQLISSLRAVNQVNTLYCTCLATNVSYQVISLSTWCIRIDFFCPMRYVQFDMSIDKLSYSKLKRRNQILDVMYRLLGVTLSFFLKVEVWILFP